MLLILCWRPFTLELIDRSLLLDRNDYAQNVLAIKKTQKLIKQKSKRLIMETDLGKYPILNDEIYSGGGVK